MSRIIKFRAWDIIDKHMYPSSGMKNDGTPIDFQNFEENDEGFDTEPSWILMQYTGLKDKNGKEIYEGDIVHRPIKDNRNIDFRNGCFYLGESGSPLGVCNEQCEVIGNIWENPELIK